MIQRKKERWQCFQIVSKENRLNAIFYICTFNLTQHMVCKIEPSVELSLGTIWKWAGTFKKYLSANWMSHNRLSSWYLAKQLNMVIGPNPHWFRHKSIIWSLMKWILMWSCWSSCHARWMYLINFFLTHLSTVVEQLWGRDSHFANVFLHFTTQ